MANDQRLKAEMKPRIAIPVPHSDREYADRALPQYVRAVEEAGGEPLVVGLELANHEIARMASRCDGVLLPGSRADLDPQKYGATARDPRTAPPDPRRDNADELLLQDAYNMRKPILGVCYGLQSLNVWRTGTLVQHLESQVNHEAGRAVLRAHRVSVDPESQLSQILRTAASEPVWVNSSHHQAAELVGDGLRPVAWAEDGVIEAVEGTSPDHFVEAVQWHPERMLDNDQNARALFRALVECAGERHQQLRQTARDFESIGRE